MVPELTYHKEGDYYYPDLVLPEEPENAKPLGKYGLMRKKYLKEHKRGTYSDLLLNGELMKHLREIDAQADQMMETLIAQMKKREGVTEELKANDQMAWVGAMNNIRDRAEEVVLHDLIYV